MKSLWVFLVCLTIKSEVVAQTPPRKAIMGMMGKPVEQGMRADSIIPNSSFALMQLQKADVITEVNGKPVSSAAAYSQIVSGIRTGEKITVKYNHQGINNYYTLVPIYSTNVPRFQLVSHLVLISVPFPFLYYCN